MDPRDEKRRRSPRTRSVVAATGLLLLGIAPFGVAATGDALREGQRNGTATKETQIISSAAETGRSTGGYATRQSNLSRSGGAAIYGCRSTGATRTNPCLRANNLTTGSAFEFNTTGGESAGRITAGSGGDSKRPFTTNATGVATGLNADRVDGQDAAAIVSTARAKSGLDADTVDGQGAGELTTRWALVNEAGQIEQQTGGFTTVDCFETNANCYLDAGEDVRNNGIHAQIAIQNNDTISDPTELSGETGTAPCGATFVTCAPPGTEDNEVLVVAPRQSDGAATTAGARLRFYVYVTGSQAG